MSFVNEAERVERNDEWRRVKATRRYWEHLDGLDVAWCRDFRNMFWMGT
jgi:hypothetical protein